MAWGMPSPTRSDRVARPQLSRRDSRYSAPRRYLPLQPPHSVKPRLTITPGKIAAVRSVLHEWGVTMVVIPDQPGLVRLAQLASVPAAAALITAATGHRPVYEEGAWVWAAVNHVSPSIVTTTSKFSECTEHWFSRDCRCPRGGCVHLVKGAIPESRHLGEAHGPDTEPSTGDHGSGHDRHNEGQLRHQGQGHVRFPHRSGSSIRVRIASGMDGKFERHESANRDVHVAQRRAMTLWAPSVAALTSRCELMTRRALRRHL